jgi:hypothetical protein
VDCADLVAAQPDSDCRLRQKKKKKKKHPKLQYITKRLYILVDSLVVRISTWFPLPTC